MDDFGLNLETVYPYVAACVGEDLTEEEENAVIFREIKQAQETVDTTPADRTQIIEEAKLRISVYSEFVPKLMDEAQIRDVIIELRAEAGEKSAGKRT